MGRVALMTPVDPAPTHDLIRLRDPRALEADRPWPSWVGPALRAVPWVIVRRGSIRDGLVPVGMRGRRREQRFAALLAVEAMAARLSPEDLLSDLQAIEPRRKGEIPALSALSRVAPLLEASGRRWGPGGSVGFELATGAATATPTSDLDLILRQGRRLPAEEARDLVAALIKAAAPARIDVVLETPLGGVSLAEIARGPARVLIRTPDGPRLASDPWGLAADSTGVEPP